MNLAQNRASDRFACYSPDIIANILQKYAIFLRLTDSFIAIIAYINAYRVSFCCTNSKIAVVLSADFLLDKE